MKQQWLSVPWQRPASPTPRWHRGHGAAGSLCSLLCQAEDPLCSHLCMVHPPTAGIRALSQKEAPGPALSPWKARGSSGESHLLFSCTWEGLEREQDQGWVWAHFWLFKQAQASPFCSLITDNSVPCLPLGIQNWL